MPSRSGITAAGSLLPPYLIGPPTGRPPGLGYQVPGFNHYRVEDPNIITEMSHGFHVLA
jgi:hypothetical protein